MEQDFKEKFFCSACDLIQPPTGGLTYFDYFGLKPTYNLDEMELRRKYKNLQSILHPDRFTNKSDVSGRQGRSQEGGGRGAGLCSQTPAGAPPKTVGAPPQTPFRRLGVLGREPPAGSVVEPQWGSGAATFLR